MKGFPEDVADYVVRLHPFSLKNNVAYASTSSKVGAATKLPTCSDRIQ